MYKHTLIIALCALSLNAWATLDSQKDTIVRKIQSTIEKLQRTADRAETQSPEQARSTLNKMHIWKNDLELSIAHSLQSRGESFANEPYHHMLAQIDAQIEKVAVRAN